MTTGPREVDAVDDVYHKANVERRPMIVALYVDSRLLAAPTTSVRDKIARACAEDCESVSDLNTIRPIGSFLRDYQVEPGSSVKMLGNAIRRGAHRGLQLR